MKVELSLFQMPAQYGKRCLSGILGCLIGLTVISLAYGASFQPEMETDELLKPLVDTSQSENTSAQKLAPLEGRAERYGQVPVNDAPASQTKLITGKVQTLQQAIESEKDIVDWYAWYLSAREYISRSGGLRCSLGTPIKFFRNGKIEALTFDTACIGSVLGKRFPLPASTRLDALILPVRPGHGPPASETEIYSRVRTKYY